MCFNDGTQRRDESSRIGRSLVIGLLRRSLTEKITNVRLHYLAKY